MKLKFKTKFIPVVVIMIGIVTVLVGEYLCATAYEFKRNSKAYIADIILIDKCSNSKLDLRRKVSVVYKVGAFNYADSFEYYVFMMPKENQIVVYNNPSRLFSESKTDWDISKKLVWPILGIIVIVIGTFVYIGFNRKAIDNKNE